MDEQMHARLKDLARGLYKETVADGRYLRRVCLEVPEAGDPEALRKALREWLLSMGLDRVEVRVRTGCDALALCEPQFEQEWAE